MMNVFCGIGVAPPLIKYIDQLTNLCASQHVHRKSGAGCSARSRTIFKNLLHAPGPEFFRESESMTSRLQVPFIPTPEPIVRRMLTLAKVKRGELVYDLGAGDGRILSSVVKDFDAKAIGIELHESRYEAITKRIEREHLGNSAGVIRGDFFNINLSQADVVTLYLLTAVNSMIKPKLERELKVGARVVSHDYPIKGWVPLYVEKVRDQKFNSHMVCVYQVPKSVTHRSSSIPRAVSNLTRWGGF
jgi:hypothetical protein